MSLDTELATFEAHVMELMGSNQGRFVVIKGTEIAGARDTYEEALELGYSRYGPVPFLVKKVAKPDPIHYFSRDLPR